MLNDKTQISGKKVLNNMLWRFAERVGAQGVNFLVSVVLARILTPEDYGVIELASIFTTILAVFMTAGLGTALIQRKEIDDLDCSTALVGNIGIGIILYGVVFFSAPYIAQFFRQPLIKNVLRVLALTLVIGGVNGIQHAKVARSMQFKLFFKATITGTVLSAIVGIWLAVKGFGVWAIVAQHLTNQIIDTVFLSVIIKWKPSFRFSWVRFKPLCAYGSQAYGAQLIETVYNSLRSLLIGRYYTGTDLAYYNRGRHIPALVNYNTNHAIQSVMFPTYSKVADDPEKFKKMMRRAISMGTFIIFPCMMGLAVVSSTLIDTIYTSKWLPATPYLQIACFVYALNPLHVVNLQAILALGKSNISLRIEIIKKTIAITTMIICIHISLFVTAFSAIPLGIMALIVNSWPIGKYIKYTLFEQLKDSVPAFLLSIIMGVFVWLLGMIDIHNVPKLILQITGGIGSYCLFAKLSRNKDYDYIKEYLISFFRKHITRNYLQSQEGEKEGHE